MEDDPFFAAVSTPAEVKPAIATTSITSAKNVPREKNGKEFGKSKERKFEKDKKEDRHRNQREMRGNDRKMHDREKKSTFRLQKKGRT